MISNSDLERAKMAARLRIGKLVTRFLSYASQYQSEQKRLERANKAFICETAVVGDRASLFNDSKNRNAIYLGENVAMFGELSILPQGGRIHIAEKTFVGPGTRIWSAASIEIGRYVLISHNVNILDNISHSLLWSERRSEIDRILPGLKLYNHGFDLKSGPIVIEDDVWIGLGSSILGSVRIGRGAIVGAGTMVTKDVPPFTVVVGNPMRIVRGLSA